MLREVLSVARIAGLLGYARLQYEAIATEPVMPLVQINARIDAEVKKAMEDYCRSRGIVMNHFVQEAILDRLEELEDVEDLKRIRHEPTRPLSDVLRELKLDGTL